MRIVYIKYVALFDILDFSPSETMTAEVQPKQTNHQVHLLNARSDLSASQKHPQIVAIFNEDGNFVDKHMQVTVHTLMFCKFELILLAMIANKACFCKAGVVATKCPSISRAAHIPEQMHVARSLSLSA